jgi:trehalose 6-phosphate phosphatase
VQTFDLAPVRALASVMAREVEGIEVEEKGVSLALHFRNTERPDEVRELLLGRLEALLPLVGGRLQEGKRVLEVVPRALPDKGTAFARLLGQTGLRGVVFMGDDLSDVAVFREIARQRTGGIAGLSIGVVDDETPGPVALEADVTVRGVEGIEELLTGLLRAIEEEERR